MKFCLNAVLIGVFLVVLAVSDVESQTESKLSKDERDVLSVNEGFDHAIVARDVAAYERIFAEDFIFTSFDGSVSNRDKEIERVRTGSLTFEYGKSDDVRVKVYGKTAVVTGRFTARGKRNGTPFSFVERYTGVFVNATAVGKWLQSTLLR